MGKRVGSIAILGVGIGYKSLTLPGHLKHLDQIGSTSMRTVSRQYTKLFARFVGGYIKLIIDHKSYCKLFHVAARTYAGGAQAFFNNCRAFSAAFRDKPDVQSCRACNFLGVAAS